MLQIYPVVLDWLEELVPIVSQIARHDRDLARQLRRSSTSVIALREMRESYAALEVAQRVRYVKPLEPAFEEQCRKILGTLVRLVFPHPS
jgi:hypothetical protein